MIVAQQARSKATETRILDAVEHLLAQRPFDAISVTDIARRGRVSVGGVYARLGSKEGILEALHARYEERRTVRMKAAFAADRWLDRTDGERVRGVIDEIVGLMSDERHVLRTFLLRYWSRPEEATPEFSDRLGDLYERACRIFLLSRDRMRAQDPELAARAALGIVIGACRDIVVMKPELVPGHPGLAREDLIDYLTAAAAAVLGLPLEES